jgi:prepilin-type N-terminal cleavage/methylation domain-containing protein
MRSTEIQNTKGWHCPIRQRARTAPHPATGDSGGFTLIELLVVISILVLLMAHLLPTLQQVRKQAKDAACQAKLRQWGVVFCMYMNDHNDQFTNRLEEGGRELQWWWCASPYYGNVDALCLCPMATHWEVNKDDPKWEGLLSLGDSSGSKFTAWRLNREFWNVDRKTPLVGSYGWSIYVPMI